MAESLPGVSGEHDHCAKYVKHTSSSRRRHQPDGLLSRGVDRRHQCGKSGLRSWRQPYSMAIF